MSTLLALDFNESIMSGDKTGQMLALRPKQMENKSLIHVMITMMKELFNIWDRIRSVPESEIKATIKAPGEDALWYWGLWFFSR